MTCSITSLTHSFAGPFFCDRITIMYESFMLSVTLFSPCNVLKQSKCQLSKSLSCQDLKTNRYGTDCRKYFNELILCTIWQVLAVTITKNNALLH